VVNGKVLDVTTFLPDHPGGELAILTFAGKDAPEEFNMIHPPDVIGKYAPNACIGELGKPGAGGAAAAAEEDDNDGGITMDEVAKHNSKQSCYVVLHGRVLDVTHFLPDHPGGELAILTFAGKDATEEFDMIHPPDVISKYAPNAVIGMLGTGKAPKVKSQIATAPPPLKESDEFTGCAGGLFYMVLGFLREIIFTIFGQKNIVLTNDRSGLTRSAMFLFFFIIVHALGNLHVFLGPDDFNGYGYFYVRLYNTGFGFEANIVEEYVLLCAVLHVLVGLKRTWDISINYTVASGKLNLAFSGILLLTFMTIHLFQFRFGDTQMYDICPPPYLINFMGILSLNLFWMESCDAKVPVRDIYKLEFDVFKSPGWVCFYLASVCVFSTHMCLGWAKVIPAPSMGVPKKYHQKAIEIGYFLTGFIALIYASFPIYAHCVDMKIGHFGKS
jgi:cytochrome b involved in lipid metabolism